MSVAYALTGWPGPDLKNHVSPVRFWPSAQNAFVGVLDLPIPANDQHAIALLSYTAKGKTYKLVHVSHIDDDGRLTEAWSFGDPDLAKLVQSK